MPLVAQTLADALTAIEPAGSEPESAAAWTDAWFEYLGTVTGAGIPAVVTALLPFKSVMVSALLGMSAPGAGPQKIQDGITAVWTSIVSATSAVFPGTIPPLTPPPGNSTIAAAITVITASNTAGNIPRDVAMLNLANAIHATQVVGGLVTLPGAPPITGPIL